jgi:hypothetical protein
MLSCCACVCVCVRKRSNPLKNIGKNLFDTQRTDVFFPLDISYF